MEKINLKCPACGYVFETEDEKIKTCPLCSSELDFKKARELYNSTKEPEYQGKSKSKMGIALEWGVFFASFIAFIFILYYIFSYILGK